MFNDILPQEILTWKANYSSKRVGKFVCSAAYCNILTGVCDRLHECKEICFGNPLIFGNIGGFSREGRSGHTSLCSYR